MQWCAEFFWLIEEDVEFVTRELLYDAYHQLNHYNIFGEKAYLDSAKCDLNNIKYALLDSKNGTGVMLSSLHDLNPSFFANLTQFKDVLVCRIWAAILGRLSFTHSRGRWVPGSEAAV